MLIEEPLSWTVNVKSFPTACQVGDDDHNDDDNDDIDDDDNGAYNDTDYDEVDIKVNMMLKAFHKGCVRTVGRTPFPSPQHPNAVYCCHSCYTKYRLDKKVIVIMLTMVVVVELVVVLMVVVLMVRWEEYSKRNIFTTS